MWGYPRPVLGAVDPFLEPFRGRLSPNIDNSSEKLTLRYPHEGPWVDSRNTGSAGTSTPGARSAVISFFTFVSTYKAGLYNTYGQVSGRV